jgi:hypothetical protein
MEQRKEKYQAPQADSPSNRRIKPFQPLSKTIFAQWRLAV